ncbi:alkaline-phosphatase-like protein [Dichotomocladium elegans]|nr:alkaline-phosphatase-like protein [Dichotomocladium elegans]
MHPSFPTITAPNHWTLVTGLHPESHGIVANEFYDPDLKKEFMFTDDELSHDPRWWKGEPIWSTLKRQQKRAAAIMWPGSTVQGHKPDIVIPFNATITAQQKMDQVLQWLDLPRDQRPHFIGVYIQDVDQQGHATGPHSEPLDNVLVEIDNAIGYLMEGYGKRNILGGINTMIVSDHGMAETDRSRVIYYDDILSNVSLSWLREREAGPLLGLRPKDGAPEEAVDRIYQELYNYTQRTPDSHFQVYLRQNVPDRFHYRNNPRISPIVAIPEVGYVLANHDEWHPKTSTEPFAPRGIHGYDNFAQDMRAIFMAVGPQIDLMYGRYSVVAPFLNTEVYSLLCILLNISPAPHNGTLDGHFYRIA